MSIFKLILFVHFVFAQSSNCDGDSAGGVCLLQLRGLDGESQSDHHESGMGLAHDESAAKLQEKLHADRESRAQEDAMGSCDDAITCDQCLITSECNAKPGCIWCQDGDVCREKVPPPMDASKSCAI